MDTWEIEYWCYLNYIIFYLEYSCLSIFHYIFVLDNGFYNESKVNERIEWCVAF